MIPGSAIWPAGIRPLSPSVGRSTRFRDPLRQWAVTVVRAHPDHEPRALTAAVADRVATALGVESVAGGAEGMLADTVEPPPGGWADPWLIGAVHEQAVSIEDRKARGAWYTPRPVVVGLIALATADGLPTRIIDATCGGGAFLLAGLDRLVEAGIRPEDAVGRVTGTDLDPVAVEVTGWSVRLWLAARSAEPRGRGHGDVELDVRVADALAIGGEAEPGFEWPAGSLIVGNPPFASPLRTGAVPDEVARLRSERAELLGPYADIAAVHLLRAVERSASGSTVALVQPQSILSGRDTAPLRAHLDRVAPLRALWASRETIFDAGVRACAPVLASGGGGPGPVRLASGPRVVPGPVRSSGLRWGALGADALGAPELPPMTGRVGELATATAGFRDEHYGLVGACREAEPGEAVGDGSATARLVTVGSIDPLSLAWGRRRYRFGGRDWLRPVVDRSGLGPKVGSWFDDRLGPKVLVATQSKVLEPVVDRAGDLMPATPVLSVEPDPDHLDLVAAVLLAPPVVAWAWRNWFGTALSVDAVKLAAFQVLELPLPADEVAWAEAAAVVAACDDADPEMAWQGAGSVAAIMTEAYQASDQVLDWWQQRRKDRPPVGS